MFFNKVSAVAITDEQGKLVANLSASELRGIGPDHLDWLLLPINDFLKKISETVEKKLSFPLTCHTDTKIEDAINMMGTYRVHRIWIGTALPLLLADVHLPLALQLISQAFPSAWYPSRISCVSSSPTILFLNLRANHQDVSVLGSWSNEEESGDTEFIYLQ